MNSSEMWHGKEAMPMIFSHNNYHQFLDMSINKTSPSGFQEFVQHQTLDNDISFEDGGHIDSTEIGSKTRQPENFIQSDITVTNSGDLNKVMDLEGCESLQNQSPSELDIQISYLKQQKYDQQGSLVTKSMNIPPTPTSIEMHCINPHLYAPSDCQHQTSYDRFQMPVDNQNIAFTPLVSPAVTPLEFQFNALGYSVQGPYFSPLSSPALQAQNDFSSLYDQQPSWATNSPVINTDCFSPCESSATLNNNVENKISKLQPQNRFGIKKSPVVRSKQRVKNTNLISESLNKKDPPNSPRTNLDPDPYVLMAFGEVLGESSSVSEMSTNMAPPPLPPPAISTIFPGKNVQNSNNLIPNSEIKHPATPASLMKIAPLSKDFVELKSSGQNDIKLVDIRKTSSLYLNSQDTESSNEVVLKAGSEEQGSRLSSLSISVTESKKKLSENQILNKKSSEAAVMTIRKPQTTLRGLKKRNNKLAITSPALLPRLSQNTKSLLPGFGKELEDSASLLLASKSNYQNILDGTSVPGISYSSELSTNLTSKRTSHKIAEQGRRNRMNSALQKIAALLPREENKNGESEKNGHGDGGNSEGYSFKGSSQSTISKARTVEQAIIYINYLKQQLEIANKKLEQTELKQDL